MPAKMNIKLLVFPISVAHSRTIQLEGFKSNACNVYRGERKRYASCLKDISRGQQSQQSKNAPYTKTGNHLRVERIINVVSNMGGL